MRSRSILPLVILAFDASGEEPPTHQFEESNTMSDCVLINSPPSIRESLRKAFKRLRSCAVMIGGAALMSLALGDPAKAQAQPTQRPNIVVIMGDDIGIWNIGAYHRGMMAGRT